MLLLMASSSLPFIAVLFVSTFSFSFSHAFLNSLTISFFLSYPLHYFIFSRFLYPLPLSLNPSTTLSAKGEGSSCPKGKEVATYDPPITAVGGKAPHSESNHSEEEEGGRAPSNECPLLIDLWYDTHIHFSMVSGDYSPPPPGHVWLSLG